MKAIGKGSIASFLAAGLHVIRVLLWIALFGLTIAMVVVPLAPPAIDWAIRHEHVSIDADLDIESGTMVEVVFAFVTVGVMLYVVERLLELLKTLRFGSPFVKENADRFRRIGFALLAGEGLKILFWIVAAIFEADIEADLDLVTLIAIAAVFVLAEVFAEGARMKEEQDLTV